MNRAVARMALACTWLVLAPVQVIRSVAGGRTTGSPSVLAIESGTRGWELPEYEELAASAGEFLGVGNVVRVVVEEPDRYLEVVAQALRESGATHYFYDPRSGSQHWAGSLWQSLRLAITLSWNDVTPIARVADFAMRRWRVQCAMVTAARGVTVALMPLDGVRHLFPHRRLIGPMPMALSQSRVDRLAAQRRLRAPNPAPRAVFTGSLYEPRTSFLLGIRDGLRHRGLDLEFETRELGGARDPAEAMWTRYVEADIVVGTAFQTEGPGLDSLNALYFSYRYCEAPAAGAMLAAQAVPGSEGLLEPGVEFAAFDTVEQAVELIAHYLTDEPARTELAERGNARIREQVANHVYWRIIDAGLGARGFVRAGS